MARIPEGAELIPNAVSAAPGFRIGNVFVMAGVPAIMQAMMDEVVKRLPVSQPLISETIEAGRGEGDIAVASGQGAGRHTRPSGSAPIPITTASGFMTRLVLRSRGRGGPRRGPPGDERSARRPLRDRTPRRHEPGKGVPGFLGPVSPRCPRARLAAQRGGAIPRDRLHHARRAGAGGHRLARAGYQARSRPSASPPITTTRPRATCGPEGRRCGYRVRRRGRASSSSTI